MNTDERGLKTKSLIGVHRCSSAAQNDFLQLLSAAAILSADPYNRSRSQNIKKLEGVPSGEGQYRLSLGRWRFRYDIVGQAVVLTYCGLRRESTY